jgi:hypothetical protein
MDRHDIPFGPVKQLLDIRLEVGQQFLAFFVNGMGILDFSVQLFDQLA